MIGSKLITKYLLGICLVFLSVAGFSQDQDKIIVDGKVSDYFTRKKLSNAKAVLYMNGRKVDETATTGGRFDFELGYDGVYTVEISAPGYAKKKIEVNTRSIPAESRTKGQNFVIPFNVPIFEKVEGMDLSVLDQPVGKFGYDGGADDFAFDQSYTKQIKGQIEQMMEELESKLQAEEEEKAAKEKAYTTAMAAARKSMARKEYVDAIANFEKALAAVPGDADAENGLEEAQTLGASAAKEAEAKALVEKYEALIKEADGLLAKSSYEEAKAKYTEAGTVDPVQSYPNEKIQEIDRLIAEAKEAEAAEEAKRVKFETLVAEADQALGKKAFDDAIAKYEEALTLYPDESYPKEQLEKANKQKAEDSAAAEKDAAYAALVKEADDLLAANDLEGSLAKYEEAKKTKPDEPYPVGKIAEIKGLLEKAKEAEKVEEEYQQAVAAADNAFDRGDFDAAIDGYNKAKTIKSDEPYPDQRIAECEAKKKELADAEAEEKLKAEYDAAVAAADESFNAADYEGAIAGYEKAKAIKSDETYPDQKIEESKAKIAELAASKEAEELQKQYDEAVASADRAFDAEDYSDAVSKYQAAKAIKSDETYPDERIKLAQDKLAELEAAKAAAAEEEQRYKDVVAAADGLFSKEDYQGAISKYEEALTMRAGDKYSKGQIEEAKKKIAEAEAEAARLEQERIAAEQAEKDAAAKLAAQAAEEKEVKYTTAIEEGDKKFNAGDFKACLEFYETASGIKPEESYPKDQLAKAKAKLSEEEAALAAKEALEKQYNDLIASADGQFEAENYEDAIASYTKAMDLKKGETYPQNQIDQANKLLAQKAAAAEQAEQELQAQAEAAEEAKKRAEEQAAREKEEKYQAHISEGDAKMGQEDYAGAIELYRLASGVKPQESYPRDQISKAEAALEKMGAEAEAQKKIQQAYDAAVATADGLFKGSDWDGAIAAYEEASKIKPAETYPGNQIKEAEKRKQQEQAEAEKLAAQELAAKKAEEEATRVLEAKEENDIEEQYAHLITQGQLSYSKQAYEEARRFYVEALDVKPEESHPKQRIEAIDKKLAELAAAENEAAEVDAAYNRAIEVADKLFDEERYAESINQYKKADVLKPAETYPDNQILEAQRKLQQQEEADAQAQAELLAREEAERAAKAKAEKDTEETSKLSSTEFVQEVDSKSEMDAIAYMEELRKKEENERYRKAQELREKNQKFVEVKTDDSKVVRTENYDGVEEVRDDQAQLHASRENDHAALGLQVEEYKQELNDDQKEKNKTHFEEIYTNRDSIDTYNEDQAKELEKRDGTWKENTEVVMKYKDDLNQEFSEDLAEHADGLIEKKGEIDEQTAEQQEAMKDKDGKHLENAKDIEEFKEEQEKFADGKDEQRKENEKLVMETKDEHRQYNEDLVDEGKKKTAESYDDLIKRNEERQLSNQQLLEKANNRREEGYSDALNYETYKQPKSYDEYYLSQLAKDFPEGVSEKKYEQLNVKGEITKIIIQRVVVKGNYGTEYKRVITKWGSFFFKNGKSITEYAWGAETQG